MDALKRTSAALSLLFLIFSCAAPAHAACPPGYATCMVTESARLKFGHFAVTDATTTHTIVLSPDGQITTPDGGFAVQQGAQEGVFDLSGFPPNFAITITADDTPVTYGGETFMASCFRFVSSTGDDNADSGDPCSSLSTETDGSGNLTIHAGATLTANDPPPGPMYPEGGYRGDFQFIVSYN